LFAFLSLCLTIFFSRSGARQSIFPTTLNGKYSEIALLHSLTQFNLIFMSKRSWLIVMSSAVVIRATGILHHHSNLIENGLFPVKIAVQLLVQCEELFTSTSFKCTPS
jgi:hypothetical protein